MKLHLNIFHINIIGREAHINKVGREKDLNKAFKDFSQVCQKPA